MRLRAEHYILSLFGKVSRFVKLLHAPSMANFERTMRSVSGVQCCRLSNLQASRVGILLVVAVAFCLNAGVVDGQACGVANGGSQMCEQGCCSQYDFCGDTSAYCGEGCQPKYSSIGACYASPPGSTTAAPGTAPECGRAAGNRKCDDNQCCSQYGFCGTSDDHCYSTKGCQSQCRLTPAQIAGTVLGALGGFAILCAITFGMFKLYLAHQRRKKINRGIITPVHRLFPVDAAEDKDTCVDIILYHGFAIGDLEREVWKNTWQTTRPSSEHEQVVCWPEVWLGRDLPEGKARVFALEYDANIYSDPQRRGSHNDVSEIAKNLLHSLFEERHKIGQSNAVVLIGHSFGGLVIKSLVLEAQSLAHQKARNVLDRAHATSCHNFVNNIRGFIFYAVPHSGAHNLEVYIKTLLRWYNRRPRAQESHAPQGTLLSNIADFSRKMEDLNEQFKKFLDKGVDDLPVFAFIEGLAISEAVDKIVEDASAIRLAKQNYYKVESANHFTVCRPNTRDEESYQKLLSVLNLIVDASPSSHRTTEQFDIEKNHGSEHSGSRSLLHPGKISALPQKLTRHITSKPNDDTLPL